MGGGQSPPVPRPTAVPPVVAAVTVPQRSHLCRGSDSVSARFCLKQQFPVMLMR